MYKYLCWAALQLYIHILYKLHPLPIYLKKKLLVFSCFWKNVPKKVFALIFFLKNSRHKKIISEFPEKVKNLFKRKMFQEKFSSKMSFDLSFDRFVVEFLKSAFFTKIWKRRVNKGRWGVYYLKINFKSLFKYSSGLLNKYYLYWAKLKA